MSRTIIDISILQTVPPSNINRDDTGSPKTARYGGVRRARVSSQAWKRATRAQFNEAIGESRQGIRTKRVVELLGDRVHRLDGSIPIDQAQTLASAALGSAGFKLTKPRRSTEENPEPEEAGYLLFLSSRQLDRVAELCVAAHSGDVTPPAFDKKVLREALDSEHSIDIALFGRMVAEATDLNVDASCQVAHAISVHAVDNEYDWYTAVDDHKAIDDEEDAGAGMIGTVEFNSSTLFRYATLDVNALQENLGDTDATRLAVTAFLRSFITSMPSGKQNTFANRTLPDAVVISLRSSQPVNPVGAFEEAITGPSRVQAASERLVAELLEIDANFGTTPEKIWVVRIGEATASLDGLGGERVTLDAAVAAVGDAVATRFASAP